jgi:sulfur carrier protein
MNLCTPERTLIVVNGEPTATHAASLAELLDELGYAAGAVATALNGNFVPRAARAHTALAAEDAVEIVTPRQGG